MLAQRTFLNSVSFIRKAITFDQFSHRQKRNTRPSQGFREDGRCEEEVSMVVSPLEIEVTVIAVAAVLLIAGLSLLYVRRRKTAAMRQKFGSEYNRAVLVHGSERKAEAKLAGREKRVERLTIRDLDSLEHERFAKQWENVQARFVDSPKGAVMEADDLVAALMKTRGYPVSDFDQRAADISVDHPKVVENYRSAHETTMRVGKFEATTDELREAMIHYRALYEELMQAPPPAALKTA